MDAGEGRNRYTVALEKLERDVRVPFDEQVTESAIGASVVGDSAWDDERFQTRLAGGA